MARTVASIVRSILLVSLLWLSPGCTEREEITGLSQLEGKVFAVPTGTVADKLVLSRFPQARFQYFNSVLDASLAVKAGKADAAAYDEPILRNIAAKNPGVMVLPDMITKDAYGFAVRMEDRQLKTTIDGVVAELRTNGTYAAMERRWFRKCTGRRPWRRRGPRRRTGARPRLLGAIPRDRAVGRRGDRRRDRRWIGERRSVGALPGARRVSHGHDHHPEPLAPIEARVAAMEAVLVERGLAESRRVLLERREMGAHVRSRGEVLGFLRRRAPSCENSTVRRFLFFLRPPACTPTRFADNRAEGQATKASHRGCPDRR